MSVPVSADLGPLIFSFKSHQDWINHGSRIWQLHQVRGDDCICLDMLGRPCRIGRDFSIAKKDNAYPVNVYLLRDDMRIPDEKDGVR